ncbi:MAG: hypothetical protein U9Q75_09545 [Pseudomonadota bacterium]|nr:hypothetical protein [Pseudomonadota bacterium]
MADLLQAVDIEVDLLQEVDIEADLLQAVDTEVDLLQDAMEVARIGDAIIGAGAEEATAPGAEAWAPETCPGVTVVLAAEACHGVAGTPIFRFSGITNGSTSSMTGSTILMMTTRCGISLMTCGMMPSMHRMTWAKCRAA